MTNHVLLDNVAHKDLLVKQFYSEEYGHNIGAIAVFSTEFADVQREYPIMIQKGQASGDYQAVALLGLSPSENLFLQEEGVGWNANYVPAVLAKGPFLIGYEDQTHAGGEANAPVLHVDLDDPRVNVGDGQSVFMPHGGNTDYLNSVAGVLDGIGRGAAIDKNMFQMFEKFDLIEPIAMDIELADGEKIRVEGHYTINQERLTTLEADELFELHQAGFLACAYMIVFSLDNVNRLIALKNSQVPGR